MKDIEKYKPELEGVLPKDEYFKLTRDSKTRTIPNDLLSRIEYFAAVRFDDLERYIPLCFC
jgi:hypothetical protein